MSGYAYLSTAVGKDADSDYNIMKNAVDDMQQWAQNDLDVNKDIYRYDFGELNTDQSEYEDSEEGKFVSDCLEEIGDNRATVEGENIVIGHTNFDWGYGGGKSHYTTSDGTTIHGEAVYLGGYVTDEEKDLFCWHEAGHNWGAEHSDAKYSDNGSTVLSATPMIASYCIDEGGDPRTLYCGATTFSDPDCEGPLTPDIICQDLENAPTPGLYHDVESEFDRDFAYCAERSMENWVEDNTVN